jgi:hypothetical protein
MPGAAILGLCEMLAHAFPGDDTGRPVLDARAIYLAVNGRKPGRGSACAASQASLALAAARGCITGLRPSPTRHAREGGRLRAACW